MTHILHNGAITLHHGDCLDVMRDIPDGSVDAIICDIPYGSTTCRWDVIIPFEPMWVHLKRIIKPKGAIVLFGSQPFTSTLVMSNLTMFKYTWQWNKRFSGNFSTVHMRPLSVVEDVIVFYRGQCPYNPQMTLRDTPITKGTGNHANPRWRTTTDTRRSFYADKKIYTEKYPTSIIDIPRTPGGKVIHPTQKPLALLEYLIRTYTNEGETVLDFTFGSCSAGVAALTTKRRFIGIERDDTYYALGAKRVQDAIDNLPPMDL